MKTTLRPYSKACELNKHPILEVLRLLFDDTHSVLEIGSGTAQHAVFFAKKLAYLKWFPSDRAEYLANIKIAVDEANLANLLEPFKLDVIDNEWPGIEVDAIFSANTMHIMHLEQVRAFFSGLSAILNETGQLVLYGPFKFKNQFTSQSNAEFDTGLKSEDVNRGIRDFEMIDALAVKAGLKFNQRFNLPANNQILVWQRAQ